MPETIILSKTNWWNDIEKTDLPDDLVWILRAAIMCLLHHQRPARATPHIIALAKKHLSGGISLGTDEYDLMLYDPDSIKADSRKFFVLVRKWPGCKLKYLSDC
jgi:hypothetical protein